MFAENCKKLTEDFVIGNVFVAPVLGEIGSTYRQPCRSENQFYLCCSGTRDYFRPQGERFLSTVPDDILFMPTGASYYTTVTGESASTGYGILFKLYDRRGHEIILGNEPEVILRDRNGFFQERFREMLVLMLSGGFSLMQIKARLYDLLYLFVTEKMREKTDMQIRSVLPAVHYMENHLQENCTVEQLAQLCFMSRSTFHRRFQEEYHDSPIAWHLNMRIQKSRELLASGMYTVERVAETMGFCDTCYFSRMFYKFTGSHARDCRQRQDKAAANSRDNSTDSV